MTTVDPKSSVREGAVLVTGITGTLGSEIGSQLRHRERPVIGLARHASSGLRAGANEALELVDVDLTDDAAVQRIFGEFAERGVSLSGLVLAHGTVAFGEARDTGFDIVRRLFDLNTLASLHVINQALALMKRDSFIINLSAVVAEFPMKGLAAYSASKAAVSAYMAALRREVRAQGIHTLDVQLPHIESDFAHRAIAGTPPPLPKGVLPVDAVKRIFLALDEKKALLKASEFA